jgi:hypothetical protein
MKHTIYYKDLLGRDTKAVLRELSTDDENYVRRVMQAYKDLAEVEPRKEFGQWFDMSNTKLPKFKDKGLGHNSPRSWCDGILDKLNQAPNRRDLSPVQCDGIEALSKEIEQMYEENLCPSIEFKNKTDKDKKDNSSFNSLFKQ